MGQEQYGESPWPLGPTSLFFGSSTWELGNATVEWNSNEGNHTMEPSSEHGLHCPSNNPAINLIRKKKTSNTKTKNSQLYKHWEGNSWSAEIKGAWESTSPSPEFSSPIEVPSASQGSLLQLCEDDLVPAKIGALWSQQGDALGLQLADINSTGSAGVEEISQLGQVTCIPCSALEQKGLHFPELAPAGYFPRSTQIILLLAALGRLFSPHNCFQGRLFKLCPLLCSWNLLHDGWTLSSRHHCFSLSLVCSCFFLCTCLCGEKGREQETDKSIMVYKIRR